MTRETSLLGSQNNSCLWVYEHLIITDESSILELLSLTMCQWYAALVLWLTMICGHDTEMVTLLSTVVRSPSSHISTHTTDHNTDNTPDLGHWSLSHWRPRPLLGVEEERVCTRGRSVTQERYLTPGPAEWAAVSRGPATILHRHEDTLDILDFFRNYIFEIIIIFIKFSEWSYMGLSVEGLSWRSKLLRSEVSAVSAAVRVSLTQLTYIQDTELSSGSVWLRCQRHKIHGDINKQ